MAPPSVRPLLRPTDSDPSVHPTSVVRSPAVRPGARTHTAPARHQVSARVRVRASVRVVRLARPLCSLPLERRRQRVRRERGAASGADRRRQVAVVLVFPPALCVERAPARCPGLSVSLCLSVPVPPQQRSSNGPKPSSNFLVPLLLGPSVVLWSSHTLSRSLQLARSARCAPTPLPPSLCVYLCSRRVEKRVPLPCATA